MLKGKKGEIPPKTSQHSSILLLIPVEVARLVDTAFYKIYYTLLAKVKGF